MDKILIYIGVVLIIVGLIWHYVPGAFSWFGNLPGDIKHKGENVSFYFPITTMILISIVLTIVFRIFGR